MTIGQVEDWITEHGLEVADPSSSSSDSLPPPPSSSEAAAPPLRRDEVERPPSPAAAAVDPVVKTEPAVTELPPPVQIKHEPSPPENSAPPLSSKIPAGGQERVSSAAGSHAAIPSHATFPVAPPTASPSPLGGGGGGPNRLEIRHLPLSITIVSLRDLVGGPSTRHISLDVSLEKNEVTAIVETINFETARAAVDRLRGLIYDDGTEERTLHAELYAPTSQASTPVPVTSAAAAVVPVPRPLPPASPPPPPPAPLSSSALPPSCPPSPPRDSRFVPAAHPDPPSHAWGEPARQRGSPGERAARDHRRRSVSPRRAGRSSSPADRAATTRRPPPLRSEPVTWLYVAGVSPRLCERALADTLAREDIEAYDIRVDQPPAYRRNDRGERVAVIALTSPQDMTRARIVLDTVFVDGLRLHCRTFRDPRTNRFEPPNEEWRYPYVTHQSNLAHPPHPHACDIVVTGLDPSLYLRGSEIRELVESECGDYTVISVKIDQKYAARAYVEMDRHSSALRAIEKIDGMIDRGHAVTVNWDGRRPAHPRRTPSPRRNGFTSRPFREFRLLPSRSFFSFSALSPRLTVVLFFRRAIWRSVKEEHILVASV